MTQEIAAVAEFILSEAEGLLRNDVSGLFSFLCILRIRSGARNDAFLMLLIVFAADSRYNSQGEWACDNLAG